MDTLKQAAIDACIRYVDSRIDNAREAMESAQRAANEEGKSSAGDKYETGRAMMQIERDKAAHQLAEAMKLRSALTQLNIATVSPFVSTGSLVITNSRKIFISIGIGKLVVNDVEVLVVGPLSPIAKAFMGKGVGDSVSFNNESLNIQEVL